MKNIISNNTSLTTLTDDDCNDVDGGLMISCNQFVMMGGALMGGIAGSSLGPGGSAVGGFLGGLAGAAAAEYICN